MQKIPQITLVGLEGPVAGRQFTFDIPEIVLGRGQGCHVILASTFVSRRHCVLRYQEDRWELADLASRNPAQINGSLTSGSLRAGDVLSIADATFRIEFPTAWSREERPTRVITRDTVAMKEHSDRLKEMRRELTRMHQTASGADLPHAGAEQPRRSASPQLDRSSHLHRHPPLPTVEELGVLQEVERHCALRDDRIMARYIPVFGSPVERVPALLSQSPPPPVHGALATPFDRPEGPYRAPSFAAQERPAQPGRSHAATRFDRPAPPPRPIDRSLTPGYQSFQNRDADELEDTYTQLNELFLRNESSEHDDEPTVFFMAPQKQPRRVNWMLYLGGLAILLVGVRACSDDAPPPLPVVQIQHLY